MGKSYLSEEDYAYTQIIEARSVIYFGHNKEAETLEEYTDYITSREFIVILLELLENNKLCEYFDYRTKDNIQRMLVYIREAIKNKPNTLSNHYDQINECVSLLNRTPGERGLAAFYKSQYLKRNSDIIPFLMGKIPFLFNQVHLSKEKKNIDESMSVESDYINSLLYQDEKLFIIDDTLDLILNPHFLDALNVTAVENPNLYSYFDFKERALYVLQSSLEVSENKSLLYEASENMEVTPFLLSRTRKTYDRLRRMK